ncbi:MAG TPA: hypothetical protein V6C69_22895 [Trichormus sp.]|jgi:hypothetical protein
MTNFAQILCSVSLTIAAGLGQTHTYGDLHIEYPDGWRIDPKVSAFGIANFDEKDRKKSEKDQILPNGKALIVVVQTNFNSLEDLNTKFRSDDGYKIIPAQIEAGKDSLDGERIVKDVPEGEVHEFDYVFRTHGHVYETSLIYRGDKVKYGKPYIQTLREITKAIRFPP